MSPSPEETTNENALPSDFILPTASASTLKSNLKDLKGKRQVLGEKTPMKESSLKRPLNAAASPSPQTKSPLKQVLSTPAPSTHPVLRDITNSAQALKNPPDLFPATSTVKRSRRLQQKRAVEAVEPVESAVVVEAELIPSKLATTVFPSSSDDLAEEREIEHASSKILAEEDDELKGPSLIIPELTDFSKNLTEGEMFEKRCAIEVVEVPFIVEERESDIVDVDVDVDVAKVDCE